MGLSGYPFPDLEDLALLQLTNKIKLKKPDVIYAAVVGGSNVAFYKQLKAAGIDLNKQTLLTISVTEDEIDGIGPTRKRALLHHFGSAKAVSRASVADLTAVSGISEETAKRIYDHFHERDR